MEGNKDDALKCLRIGKQALESGDRSRALKFINKARRLDPTIPVDDLLSRIEGEDDKPPHQSPEASAAEDQPSIRQRVRPAGASLSSSPSVTYTEEQVTIVRQLKKKKDYYEILGLEKGCADEEVKKAYRKLSLKVHPDKNKAPGAEEAFKAVSRAFQCLSNEESRKKYDLTGSEEPILQRRAPRGGYSQGFGGGFYEAEFDPDEIFRNFFGGMHPATTQYRTYSFGTGMGQRNGENASGGSNLRMLIQLLPVLLILLMSFMPSQEPIYSLSRSHLYAHKFTTHKGVNYYVKSKSFDQEYPPNSRERSALEGGIEREYASILHHNCRLEMQRRQWGYVVETPHCDMFRQFQAAA